MPGQRKGKRSVQKDHARERRLREQDAAALETAAAIIQKRFTRQDETISMLEWLAGKIREGAVDHTDHLLRG